MDLVTRKEWGARTAKQRTPLVPGLLRGIAIHYTAMNADEQADHANCPRRVRGIQSYHMDTNGWSDIAYSFVVCKHGSVFEGRGWGVRTAAQGTNAGNDGYHAACFLGDDTKGRDDVTEQGRRAFTQVVRKGQRLYPKARFVLPHSDFHSTACPGDELRAWVKAEPWKKLQVVPLREKDWRWARWYLSIGEYAGRGKKEKGKATRPPYQRIVGPRGWRAARWYKRHGLA
jgi:hypothetical protein